MHTTSLPQCVLQGVTRYASNASTCWIGCDSISTWHSQLVLHVQIKKRIRCPDTSRAFGSDVDGFNRMADTLKSELDVCKGNFPEDTLSGLRSTWPPWSRRTWTPWTGSRVAIDLMCCLAKCGQLNHHSIQKGGKEHELYVCVVFLYNTLFGCCDAHARQYQRVCIFSELCTTV